MSESVIHDLLIEDAGRVNPHSLNAELRASLGTAIAGASSGPYGVRVHFVRPPSKAQEAKVLAVLNAHDPDAPSDAEQQAADDAALFAAYKAGEKVDMADVLAAMARKLGLV